MELQILNKKSKFLKATRKQTEATSRQNATDANW